MKWRSEKGKLRKIICGATNPKEGDKVVLALPGAVLPGNFVIKISKIRGEESCGMLVSHKELGLETNPEKAAEQNNKLSVPSNKKREEGIIILTS